ncbi:MAG TPA: ADP-ribosylglycohydrolase family protein [Spirochaetota bacterium]|nr:ADP-ribosylglycohydrolase family protein [Spirochaetota bacterium]
MKEKFYGTFMGAVAGNALGTPFDGMSRGHIASHFRNITGHTDPEPALKQNMMKWKKPGLYGSASQLMIILYLTLSSRNTGTRQFEEHVLSGAGKGESGFGIFRNPGPAEGLFIQRLKEPESPETYREGPGYPDCSCIPVLLPLLYYFHSTPETCVLRGLEYCRDFSTDEDTAAGTMIFLHLLSALIPESPAVSGAASEAEGIILALRKASEKYSPELFSLGYNPDAVFRGVEKYHRIYSSLNTGMTLRDAESAIINAANPFMKTPVTRATVNHPLLVLPFAWHIARSHSNDPGSALFAALREGGSTTTLCMLTGIFCGALHGGAEWIPEPLIAGLINKTRILALGQAIREGKKAKEDISSFIEAEHALTQKSQEEYNSKLRHYKPKSKKPKSRHDQERELSHHVVESWTKLDKAKWKKQRKKQDDHNK